MHRIGSVLTLVGMTVVFAVGMLIITVACSSTTQQRELCYADNELHALTRATKECPGGGPAWDACPARPAILAELKQRHAACP